MEHMIAQQHCHRCGTYNLGDAQDKDRKGRKTGDSVRFGIVGPPLRHAAMRRSRSPSDRAPQTRGAAPRAAESPHGAPLRYPVGHEVPPVKDDGVPGGSPPPVLVSETWKLNLHIAVGGEEPITSSDGGSGADIGPSAWFTLPCEPVPIIPGAHVCSCDTFCHCTRLLVPGVVPRAAGFRGVPDA